MNLKHLRTRIIISLSSAFILFIFIGFTNNNVLAADKSNNINWAVVNYNTIFKKLNSIALQQHPYPKSYNIKSDELKKDKHLLNKQISKLKIEKNKPCLTDKAKSQSYKNKMILNPKYYPRYYDKKCIADLPQDDLIKNLESQEKNIKEISKKQGQHKQKLMRSVQKIIHSVISENSKDKFDLVIAKKSKIFYSKSGTTLDATAFIMRRIEKNPPTINL